jgi:hypothetical protein
MDCLTDAYSQQSLDVGSDTYFNIIKNCYVRAIKDLGILEQTYIDEPEAFFFVQKLQAIEVDLQHMLAIEDQKAKMAPIPVPTPTPVPLDCVDLLVGDGTFYSIPCPDPDNIFDGSTCATDCVSVSDAGEGCGIDDVTDGIEHCGPGCCYIPCNDNGDCPEGGGCDMVTTYPTNDGPYGFCNINTQSAGCCFT